MNFLCYLIDSDTYSRTTWPKFVFAMLSTFFKFSLILRRADGSTSNVAHSVDLRLKFHTAGHLYESQKLVAPNVVVKN